MSKYFIEDTTLTAIGDAIRDKAGTTELIKVSELADAIANIPSGGGGEDLSEALKVNGNCQYRFAYNGWNKLIEDYGNQITTENITNAQYMFIYSNNLTSIPFEINVADKTNCYQMFGSCENMITAPKINGKIGSVGSIFASAKKLENIPDIECDNSTY
jgi:hypothetical protein